MAHRDRTATVRVSCNTPLMAGGLARSVDRTFQTRRVVVHA